MTKTLFTLITAATAISCFSVVAVTFFLWARRHSRSARVGISPTASSFARPANAPPMILRCWPTSGPGRTFWRGAC
jgi:hypothetical protein